MPVFERESPETIKGRILERMETDLQTREGSYTNDLVSPVAFELWRWAMTLDELVTAFYVDEDSGKYLDMHAKLLGLVRKAGTRATAVITLQGRPGTIVPRGTGRHRRHGPGERPGPVPPHRPAAEGPGDFRQ